MLPPTRNARPPNIFFSVSARSSATRARIRPASSSSYATTPILRMPQSDGREHAVERRGHACRIERVDEQAGVARLAPAAAAHEAMELLLARPAAPRRLLLQRAERVQVTLDRGDLLDRLRSERADQL